MPNQQNVINQVVFTKDGVSVDYKLGDLIEGYYVSSLDKFYKESIHETEIQGSAGYIYVDLAKSMTYRYDETNLAFYPVGGEREITRAEYDALSDEEKMNGTMYFIVDEDVPSNIICGYLNQSDGKFYQDSSYTIEIDAVAEALYIELNTNVIYRYDTTTTSYIAISAGGVDSSVIEGYYNSSDGKFYEESTFETEITGVAEKLYIDLGEDKIYYYDVTDAEYVLISGGGGGGGSYTAGFGIDIDNDEIKTTDFVGTQVEWNALTPTQQAAYDFIHITDDTSSVTYKPGHSISDGTGEKTQRDGLVFEGFTVTDDSTNEVTKIAEIPYTAGDGINISNKEIVVSDDIARTWTGTTAQWNAIVDKSIYDGWNIEITDDSATGAGVVVDTIADGNMNAVTSNAVYSLESTLRRKFYVIGGDVSVGSFGEAYCPAWPSGNRAGINYYDLLSIVCTSNDNILCIPYNSSGIWAFKAVNMTDMQPVTAGTTLRVRCIFSYTNILNN